MRDHRSPSSCASPATRRQKRSSPPAAMDSCGWAAVRRSGIGVGNRILVVESAGRTAASISYQRGKTPNVVNEPVTMTRTTAGGRQRAAAHGVGRQLTVNRRHLGQGEASNTSGPTVVASATGTEASCLGDPMPFLVWLAVHGGTAILSAHELARRYEQAWGLARSSGWMCTPGRCLAMRWTG
jgi:hypothetical protein